MATAGKTSERKFSTGSSRKGVKPVAGNQPSPTAKTRINISASQKSGMAAPSTASVVPP